MSGLTDWVASALETDEDILVAVKKLWVEYSAPTAGISLDEFTRTLEADARFEFMEGTDPTKGLDDWAETEIKEHVAEMEALGYFGGPRVKMKHRAITAEHIAKMIKKHTDRMMSALWSAYDVRPEDLDESKDAELLDLIARAKELQLGLQEASEIDDLFGLSLGEVVEIGDDEHLEKDDRRIRWRPCSARPW